jgi:hypothetical protein
VGSSVADIDYGYDFSTFPTDGTPDLDPTFTPITGTLAVAQCIARGLMMPRGRLIDIGGDQRNGFYLRRYLAARITPKTIAEIKMGCQREALLDERVKTATATVTYDSTAHKVSVSIVGMADEGPFELVVAVSQLTTELLKAS